MDIKIRHIVVLLASILLSNLASTTRQERDGDPQLNMDLMKEMILNISLPNITQMFSNETMLTEMYSNQSFVDQIEMFSNYTFSNEAIFVELMKNETFIGQMLLGFLDQMFFNQSSSSETFFHGLIPSETFKNQGFPNGGFPNQGFPNGNFPNQQGPNQGSQETTRITSRDELVRKRNMCAKMMQQINGIPTEDKAQCDYVNSFTVRDMTSFEALQWLVTAQGESRSVDMLRDEKTGLTTDGLKILLHNMTQLIEDSPEMPLDNSMTTVMASLAAAIFKRRGGMETITVDDAKEFGVDAINMLPQNSFGPMPKEVFDYVLEAFNNQTDNYMKVKIHILTDPVNATKNNLTLDKMDDQYKGSLENLVSYDPSRLKSIARSAFSRYKGFDSLSVENLNKIRFLLPLAPPRECKKIPITWVQNNFETLSALPILCDRISPTDNDNMPMWNLLKNSHICGKYLAVKALSGNSPQPFSTNSEMESFKNLLGCIPGSYIKTALQGGGCSLAKEIAESARPEVVKYTITNCIQMPSNMSALNCSYIQDTFGPMLSHMQMNFFNQIPVSVLCDNECVSYFKGIDDMPTKVKRVLTKKCFSADNKVMDASAVDELGPMVTELSPKKFKEINAADLERNIAAIKANMKKSPSKRNRRKQAIMKEMGEKLIKSGKLSAIRDSKDIMREVSLKDLKASVTDLENELGGGDAVLTDSQTKWVMRELKKQKPANNYTAEEIRGRHSLVKGFLRSDIVKMAKTQIASENPQSLELAKALCEQSDWPLAPLKAINRKLIVGGLAAMNPVGPLSHLTDIDVGGLDCQCLMHFTGSELSQMAPEVCTSVCTKLGSCDRFRCMAPSHRRGVQQACMTCLNFAATALTESDLNQLGPNLLSVFSGGEVQTRVTGAVLSLKVSDLKGMCMNQDLTTAITGILTSQFGNNGSAIDETTLTMLGSAIMFFPLEMQQQMDKAVIMTIVSDIMDTIKPSDDLRIKLMKCCEQWMSAGELAYMSQLKHNLMLTIKDAVIYKIQNARRKRSTVIWTCDDIKLIGEAFTTATDAEIDAMAADEFTDCLTDIGELTLWNDAQKSVLLEKTVNSLNTSVCNMTADQLIQLGAISQVLSMSELECLPLSDTDLLAVLGGLTGWNSTSLSTLADGYMSSGSIGDLSSVSVTDVAMLGEIICGFNPANLSTIPKAVVGGSGVQLGRLSDCSIAQYTALKDLLIDPSTYGLVANWSAASVAELNNLLVGLSAQDIPDLSVDAIEGLSADVISQLPGSVLSAMTTDQFGSLTSAQVALVTDDQKQSMSQAQLTLLTNIIEGTGNNNNEDSSRATGVVAAVIWILSLAVMLILLEP